MPLDIPPTYYEAAFTHSFSGSLRSAVCTLGLHYGGASFTTDAPSVPAAWRTNIIPLMTTITFFSLCTLRDASGTVFTEPETLGGSHSTSPAPTNIAWLVRKDTGVGGRKNRGRFYLPGMGEVDVDGVGNISSASLTAVQAGLNGLVTDLFTAGFDPVILHNSVMTPTPVINLIVEGLAGTQRQRMRK